MSTLPIATVVENTTQSIKISDTTAMCDLFLNIIKSNMNVNNRANIINALGLFAAITLTKQQTIALRSIGLADK
ncbi:MAG: hypothetical protein IKT93_00790 [Clostridia bacterium]|nr:hypothetical protein [Clostridia bacterium]